MLTSRAVPQPPNPSLPTTPLLTLSKSTIRPYQPSDAPSIAHHANNPAISRWMTNIFPSPYTIADGERWINYNLSLPVPQNFVIAVPVSNLAIGGIGLKPGTDVHERSVEFGYWLGEEYWGKGIVTEAVVEFVGWLFREWGQGKIVRVWAWVFGGNGASAAVLRKAGFEFEGRMRQAVWKEGRLLDLEVYAMLREEWEALERERGPQERRVMGERTE